MARVPVHILTGPSDPTRSTPGLPGGRSPALGRPDVLVRLADEADTMFGGRP